MQDNAILSMLNARYPIAFDRIELFREGGNTTYTAYAGREKYFVKIVGAAFGDTFRVSVEIQLYLMQKHFSVPPVVFTADGRPYVEWENNRVIVYEFLETTEIDVQKDAEAIGALIGELHRLMTDYPGALVTHDKAFYVDRYIDILREKRYSKAESFRKYGETLWERVKKLPRGYSHGDMYSGNIARGADGRLYVLDFDTSCVGFPTYDLALICNQTDYFQYDETGLPKTEAIRERMLPAYENRHALTDQEKRSIFDMLALYHFALQATIIEIYGLDCVDEAFFDKQLNWLTRWKSQRTRNEARLTPHEEMKPLR